VHETGSPAPAFSSYAAEEIPGMPNFYHFSAPGTPVILPGQMVKSLWKKDYECSNNSFDVTGKRYCIFPKLLIWQLKKINAPSPI
jgi:hypothetical protein